MVRDYLRHGELGIALDHVLYMIRELDLTVPAGIYGVLSRAAGAMKIGDSKLVGVKVASDAG